jgi:hypothetical protein
MMTYEEVKKTLKEHEEKCKKDYPDNHYVYYAGYLEGFLEGYIWNAEYEIKKLNEKIFRLEEELKEVSNG